MFFEHLRFTDLKEPIVDRVNFGSMMNTVDFDDRWVYHGSFTTPPCKPVVYWNVINNIFPIKLDEFRDLKKMIEFRKEEIGSLTNIRPIQPIINQNIKYIAASYLSKVGAIFAISLSLSALY